MNRRRAPRNRRSWLFLPGAERQQLLAAPALGADVLIQELEDSVPASRRGEARGLCKDVLTAWNAAGVVSAVRVNPLELGGLEDLQAAMPGRPAVVLMSKVGSAEQVQRLDEIITALERELGIADGFTEIVPNIETAAGLVRTGAIVAASRRVTAALVAAEDMAADLGAERTPGCTELAYVRSRFLVECVAAGVLAIDCPYTFTGVEQAEADTRQARALGYLAKSIVNADQVPVVNRALTPSDAEVAHARRVVRAFEAARAQGHDRAQVDGLMIEVPTQLAARRLLARAEELERERPRPGTVTA
jgi:citrate lyase subunit beta/citryl-CoA lyase